MRIYAMNARNLSENWIHSMNKLKFNGEIVIHTNRRQLLPTFRTWMETKGIINETMFLFTHPRSSTHQNHFSIKPRHY